jgi:O-methyltransferase involved in polyketide biosynthesis
MTRLSQPLTAVTSWDWLRLGQTSGKRSAEIVAGLRALTFPSPAAQGLSSAAGRWYARLLKRLNSDEGIANATGARQICLTSMVEIILAASHELPTAIVELAAGFNSRALTLAQQFPQTKVVEIDQASVIEAKQERVRQLCGDRLPPNLYWLSADLAVTELTELLDKQSIDLVIAEGIFAYLPPEEIVRIAAAVRTCLMPKGIFMTDILSASGWQDVEAKSGLAAWFLKRQVGRFKGAMADKEATRGLFRQAGYAHIDVNSLKTLADEYMPKYDVADTSFLVAAHN